LILERAFVPRVINAPSRVSAKDKYLVAIGNGVSIIMEHRSQRRRHREDLLLHQRTGTRFREAGLACTCTKATGKVTQLVPAEWVERSTRVDTSNGSAARYQYQWWLPSPEGDFMAQGILGQFVYVDPARELVIVRLGDEVRWRGVVFRSFAIHCQVI
jgi:hypothetical protein